MKPEDGTVWRTPAPGCPACREGRPHETEARRKFHPWSGHGFDGNRWTDVMLDPLPPLKLRGAPDPEENR